MANDNVVTLVGNLTREPELRFTPSGQAVTNFGLAVNRSWTDRQTNEKKEQTSFVDVQAWGTLGENVATSLPRGARVIVVGRLDQRSWEDTNGEKRSKIEITADNIGPDLRFATVQVNKNERRRGDNEVANEPAKAAVAVASNGHPTHDADDPLAMAPYVSYITAVDELNAPPEQQVLEISMVGDDVCLGIVRVEENFTTSTFTKVHEDAGIIVSKQDLLDILLADLPEAAGHVKVRVNGDKDVAKEMAAMLGRLLREKLSQT